MLNEKYLFEDPMVASIPAENPSLRIESHGSPIFGRILLPGVDTSEERTPVAVFLHGYPGVEKNQDMPQAFRRVGMAAVEFSYRGVWGSHGYYCLSHLIEDTETVLAHLRENAEKYRIDSERIYIIGHSMGGYASALYGTMFPGKVDGYVLSGAWTRDNKGLTKAAIEAPAPDLFYIPNELGDGVCSDPAVGRAYEADPYVIKEMSLGLFRAVNAGQKWMKENAEQFTDPVILLHGADDALVDVTDSLEFFQEIGSSDKSMRIYAGLMHEIFNEYDKDAVIDDALEWLAGHADFIVYAFDAGEEIDE